MFRRKSSPLERGIETLIGPNSTVLGDLAFVGRCHIDGLVKGNVSADPDSQAALSIAEDGSVEGGVAVPHVMLQGIVRGDVIATQRVELGPTARVIGNVYYNLIEMAIGAEINGKLVHKPEGHGPQIRPGSPLESRERRAKTTESGAAEERTVPARPAAAGS